MNKQQTKSTKFKIKNEAIENNNLSLNKKILSKDLVNSIFNSIETERSSEKLFNELRNKKGMNKLIEVKEENNKHNNTISSSFAKENIELLIRNIKDDQINNKNNSLNSLYLTKILKNKLNNDKSQVLDSSEFTNNKALSSPSVSPSERETLLSYLNNLTKFNKMLVKDQHVSYQFNKANNKSDKFLFDKTTKLLNLTFLAMGCLMSKPIYKVIYTKNNLEFEHDIPFQNTSRDFTKKVYIDLSYFIRKNQNRYLYNNVEVNDNIIHISHPDNINSDFTDSVNNSTSIRVSQRNNILCKYNDRFKILTDYLNSVFNSEVELNLVRLHKVFYDGQILVQDIALKSYKFRFVKLVSKLFKRLHIQKLDYSDNLNKTESSAGALHTLSSSPSYLSGINIKLAGRTFRQRVVPRMTVKRIQKGSLTNVNVQYIDKARFTGKTRRGAYSFTITLGHVFK